MLVNFLLVCEGTSDRGLMQHLESLCVRAGATTATGVAPDFGLLPMPPGKSSDAKILAALRHVGDIDLIFIHEDADARDAGEVRERICERVARIAGCPPHVCVIPVRELEAWLLVDQDKIRLVAGNQRGRHDLELPPPRRIEDVADAKKLLRDTILKATGEHGRRRHKYKVEFPDLRRRLLQLLDIDGPVNELSAWRQLVQDVNSAIAALKKRS